MHKQIPLILIILTATGCTSVTHEEEAYPTRDIKVIVPFNAGGETDTFARFMQASIEQNDLLPVKLVIINQDGAGATVGSRRVRDAEPDGYTVLCLHNALFTAKYAKKVDYGPEAFEPIAGTGEFGMVIATRESSRFKSLPQLMTAARAQPKTIPFGVNRGTPSHFAAQILENAAPGAQFRFAQSGSGVNRYHDVIGGHVELSAFAVGEYVRFDGLRALAYFGEERMRGIEKIRKVPTAREQGMDVVTSNMQFWWFPKGTPKKRVDYIAGVLERAMQTKYMRSRLKEIYCEPAFVKRKKLQRRIDDYTQKLERVLMRSTITLPNVPLILSVGVLGMAVLCWLPRFLLMLGVPGMAAFHRLPGLDRMGVQRLALLAVVSGLTIGYVLLLSLQAPYSITTSGYVTLLGAALTRGRPKSLAIVVALALILGFGLQFVFTKIFVIDLP